MDIRIRTATERDYEAVNRIMAEGQDAHAEALPRVFARTQRPAGRQWYDSYIRNGLKCIFLAERPPQTVGYAMIEIREAPRYEAFVLRRYALVNEIGVTRLSRRQGIGTRLFQACVEWAAVKGAASVELTVWEFNEPAIRFYESLGMRTLNRTMSLELNAAGGAAEQRANMTDQHANEIEQHTNVPPSPVLFSVRGGDGCGGAARDPVVGDPVARDPVSISFAASGFNHATIRVSDLERSLRFYRDLLGMKLVHRGNTDVYLEWGRAWVCLVQKDGLDRGKDTYGIDHIAFSVSVEHFHKAVAELKKAGVPIVRGPVWRGGGWSVNFLDPDGTEIECFTGTLAERMKTWK